WRRRVNAAVLRVLPGIAAAFGDRPDVHRPVAIAEKVDATVPEHRILARAFVVRRQRRGFLVPLREAPQVLCRAALVSLGVAPFTRESSEIESPTRGVLRRIDA